MTCREVRSIIPDFLDERLDGPRCRWVLDHMADCEACRKEAAALRFVDACLRAAMSRVEVSPDFVSRVMQHIVPYPACRSIRWSLRGLTAAVAAGLLLALGIGVLRIRAGKAYSEAASGGYSCGFGRVALRCEGIRPGPAFVIGPEGLRPYSALAPIRIRRMINGTPEFVVEAFGRGDGWETPVAERTCSSRKTDGRTQ